MWQFVLSTGVFTTRPRQDMGEVHVKACLAKRFDPVWSINPAVDYGIANLKVLEGKGYKLDGLNDLDKAKLMYLMHHEGEGQGPNFVGNTLNADRLRSVFRLQTKKDGEWIERAKGNVADGYRAWFADYVDTKFRGATKEYFCPEKPAVISADLTKILVAIGGKEIPDVKTP